MDSYSARFIFSIAAAMKGCGAAFACGHKMGPLFGSYTAAESKRSSLTPQENSLGCEETRPPASTKSAAAFIHVRTPPVGGH